MEILPVQAKLNTDVKADLTPAIQAASNLVDSPRKGIAKILQVLVGPWVANRERNIALLQAQTEKDCEDIKNGAKLYREGQLLVSPNPATAVDPYDALHTLNHMADAKRLKAAVEEAVHQISDIPPEDISDEPISQTFFNRWRREAEMIDEDDLRQFWAKLLVEETKKPTSISPRTLDIARNLSREEATLFEHMAKYVFEDALILNKNGAPPVGQYIDILKLINAGVVGSQTSRRQFGVQKDKQMDKSHADILFENDGFLIRCFAEKVQVSCHVLTNEGVALLKLLHIQRSQEDIINIAKAVAGQGKLQSVAVHVLREVSHPSQGEVEYSYQLKAIWTTQQSVQARPL